MVEWRVKKIEAEEKNSDTESAEFRHICLVIDRFQAGRRLDLLLGGRYPALSRSAWQDRIRAGEVTLNEQRARPSRIVQEGEIVRFSFKLRPEPEVDRNIKIAFEDEALLIIDKPGDLPIHASGGYRNNTLNALLSDLFAKRGEADFVCRPAHRLDRETSGLIVYAKSTPMARKLMGLFLSSQVEKYYLTIVFGRFHEERICEGWIGTDAESRVRKKQRYHEGKQERGDVSCSTDFRSLRHTEIDGHTITLLLARLHTGRMHQIRATLFSLGYPVVGDRLYGPDEGIYLRRMNDAETDADKALLILDRTALHCTRLVLPHPRSGERLEIESPLPESMERLLRQ